MTKRDRERQRETDRNQRDRERKMNESDFLDLSGRFEIKSNQIK